MSSLKSVSVCLSYLSDYNEHLQKIPNPAAERPFRADGRTDRHDEFTHVLGYFFMYALGN
jgi:hypothetical protein